MNGRAIDTLLWAAGALLLSALLFFSFGPDATATLTWATDGMLHAAGYAIVLTLFLLAGVWRPGRGPGPLAGKHFVIAGAAVALSIVIELLQLVFARSAQVSDVLANAVGALVALAALEVLRFVTEP